MVISVWNSFLSMLRSRARKSASISRRRLVPRLAAIEQMENRVLLTGNLSLTDAFLIDSAGVRLPTGTLPVIGEAVYVRVEWTEAGVSNLENYTIGVQLRQYLNQIGPSPSTATYTGQQATINYVRTQFAGYASTGLNSLRIFLDSSNGVAESNETILDNSRDLTFTAADPVDPASLTRFPTPLVTPVTGVNFRDWFLSYADVDPRPTGSETFAEDYTTGSLTFDGQFGDSYAVVNFNDMDNGRVAALAVANATVLEVVDGNFDRNTSGGSPNDNYILLDLGNNWTARYSNMMSGTITVKVGDLVETNDVLGLIGSSGDSSRAHLNFRLFHNGNLVNPGYAPTTYYATPLPYEATVPFNVVNSGITNVDPDADFLERPQDYTTFTVGSSERAWLWVAGNRYLPTEPLVATWYRPNGTVGFSHTVTPSGISTGGYFFFNIDSGVYGTATGNWQVAVTVLGTEVLRKNFSVSASAGAPEIRVQQELPLGLNRYLLNDRTTPVDFGTTTLANPNSDIVFTIQNTGGSQLSLSNLVLPTGFTALTALPTTINANSSAQFTVRFGIGFRGRQFGNITFTTNDPDEQKFRFAVTGNANLPLIGPDVDHPGPAMRYLYQMLPQVISPTAQLVSTGAGLSTNSALEVFFAAGGRAEDRLGILNQGTQTGQIGVTGSTVTYGGTSIGTFVIANDPVSGAQKLSVDFNGSVTQAAVTALMRNITYVNPTVVPNTHPRYVQFIVSDSTGRLSDAPAKVIDIVPDTHPPEVFLVVTPVTVPSLLTTTQDFQILYTDEVSVDGTTPDRNDILNMVVVGPGGATFPVIFYNTDSSANGLQRTTFWTLPAPGGFWDIRDNGVYTVLLAGNQVRDINGNVTPAQTVGTFTINLPNVPPWFTNTITGQLINEDTPTAPISVQINDLETAPGALVLTATSSNPALVAANGFTFGGSGANRTVVVTPLPNAFGSTTITLQLTDEHLGVTTQQFLLLVQSVNDLPVVSVIPNQDIQQDTTTSLINFTVSDVETAAGSLTLAAVSNNPGLIQNSQVVIGGTPGNPTLLITPEPGQFGIADITINVTDTNGGTTPSTFQVLVRENSQPPVIPANQIFSVPENSAVGTPVGTVLATDADAGQTLTYAITGGDPGNAFTIAPSSGALTVRNTSLFNFEGQNVYTLTISVTDNSFPGVTTTGTVTVNVTNVNEAPVVPNRTVSILENPANGTGVITMTATDVDAGQTRLFSISSGNPNNAFAIDPVTGVVTVNVSTAVDFETSPTIVLTIASTDNGAPAQTGFGTLTVTLGNVNEPPTIAPQTKTVREDAANGTNVGTVVATDQDAGQTLNFAILDGNTGGAFAIHQTSGVLTVANSSALNFEGQQTYLLTVQVTDNANPALSSQAVITVNLTDVNEIPVVPPQSFSIDENSAINTPVGTVAVNNPESGQGLTFTITGGNTGGAFAIHPTTGALRVANPAALNFEVTQQIALSIQVVDNGNPIATGTGTVTINLNNLNEPPLVLDQVFSANENLSPGINIGTVQALDVDAGQTLTYAITGSSVPGVFAINPQNGVITVADPTNMNFETHPTITLNVQVTDSGAPGLSTSSVVTINLQNVNDAPVVPNQTLTFAENQLTNFVVTFANGTDEDLPAQTLSYSIVGGNNGGAFAIDPSNGRITVANAAAVDFETSPQFLLQVQARDNGLIPRTGVGIVTINLTDVNEPPLVPTQSLIVPEKSAVGFVVGNVIVNNPEVNQTLAFTVLGGNETGTFAIHPTTGQVTVANPALLDFENPTTFVMLIEVTDNGAPPLTRTGTLTITISDVNEFPVFPGPYAFTIDENTAQGTPVGTIQATDPDFGQTLQYAISAGNPGNAFAINQSTGVISVAQPSQLDFETTPVFTLTVQAQDNGNPRRVTSNTVTITLRDVNDPPKILGQAFQIDENSPNQTPVGNVIASDADAGQTISYAIQSGNTGGAFEINATTGALTVVNSQMLNFEANPTFNLVIRVTDTAAPTPVSSTANVTVSLRNVNEAPVIPAQAKTVLENSGQGRSVGNVDATDPEPGQSILYSIVSGNTNGTFAINANTGALSVLNPALLNFETNPSFTLTIRGTDNANPPLSSTGVVTVNVIDVNEQPQIANQSVTIDENTPNGTQLGTVTALDPDANADLTYSIIGGDPTNAFSLNPMNGVLTVSNSSLLNFEARQVIVLTVGVEDEHGLSNSASVSLNLTNVNDAPAIADAAFTISENSAAGTVVGIMPASDQDAGQVVTFSIVSGNTGGAFAISSLTGKITVVNPAALDFETNPTFTLGVRAADNGSPSASRTATAIITLSNLDEPLAIVFRPEPTPVRPGQKNILIDPLALVRDVDSPDSGLLGVTLTVSLSSDTSTKADKLNLLVGQNGLSLKGKSLLFGGIKIGTIAGGKQGSPLYISFTSEATLDALEAIVRGVTISLGKKHTTDTMDVKFRLSGAPGVGGQPAIKTLSFVQPLNVAAVAPAKRGR